MFLFNYIYVTRKTALIILNKCLVSKYKYLHNILILKLINPNLNMYTTF